MWMIYSFISKTLSLFFPPYCYICHRENTSLCPLCLHYCKKNLNTPYPYITSVYNFQDTRIKKIIHAIKYFHRKDLIEPLTGELARILESGLKIQEAKGAKDSLPESLASNNYNLQATGWVLVPIPMPPLRKYMRGYNQAELITQSLSRKSSLPMDSNILLRSHSSKRQAMTKTRSDRLKNQHNTFKIIKNVTNMSIILVDDVTTTGATLEEARNLLLKNGASHVRAVTIAH